ncbi:hypothetical protein Y032_0907g2975 [Ancylostoma ceylanicum]|uniref:Uncharacterized protein n=1 Tax=Ancylostoma ceylanicum TaxID=53326 RepID=A0A016WAM6_9BILA|nr:hypothetical protein Y032_0907g2975 [Ancylostoma ceylanicum]
MCRYLIHLDAPDIWIVVTFLFLQLTSIALEGSVEAKPSILQTWHLLTLLAKLIAIVQVFPTKTSKFVVFRRLKVTIWRSCPADNEKVAMMLLELLHFGKPN